ncbi:MAG: phosphoadenylyl-sulfate reductase [Paludibacteraceae bacterium]|nr:phosphoadenylyl-sulfate reductase [Paludibacteraceae bacterium]
MTLQEINELNERFATASPEEVLAYFLPLYNDRIALASSLGLEDQVLTAMITKIKPDARIFTIDTGRLFPESYLLIDRTNEKYDIKIEVYSPEHTGVENYVKENGINAFYQSIELRKACCHCRKLEPLKRALSTVDVWICGLRASQAVTRTGIQIVEWDANNGLIKVNPLARWSEEDVWQYIRTNRVPYNKLHDKGFPSIGCQPCTRAIEPGEDIRAGRWWWEDPEHKECGLHKR